MVLVTYEPNTHPSSLQTKFRNREGHEARRIRLEAMPLDQHIEGRHGEREPGVKIRPASMYDLLEVHDERRLRSWHRPLYALRGGLKGAGTSSTVSKIAANIERGF